MMTLYLRNVAIDAALVPIHAKKTVFTAGGRVTSSPGLLVRAEKRGPGIHCVRMLRIWCKCIAIFFF